MLNMYRDHYTHMGTCRTDNQFSAQSLVNANRSMLPHANVHAPALRTTMRTHVRYNRGPHLCFPLLRRRFRSHDRASTLDHTPSALDHWPIPLDCSLSVNQTRSSMNGCAALNKPGGRQGRQTKHTTKTEKLTAP